MTDEDSEFDDLKAEIKRLKEQLEHTKLELKRTKSQALTDYKEKLSVLKILMNEAFHLKDKIPSLNNYISIYHLKN